MKDLNDVNIIGRLVRDPEIKYTQSGTAVTKFSIANNDSYTKNNQTQEHVNFFNVVVWGNAAVNCDKYLFKGSQVAISGSLKQNRWINQNGESRSNIEITATKVQFLSKSQNNTNQTVSHANNNQNNNGFIADPWDDQGDNYKDPYAQNNDDIPF